MPSFVLEKKLLKDGYKIIAGLDEAGRGPLAGPVVAACVACDCRFSPPKELLTQVNDSKKLSPKKRNELFLLLMENANLQIGIGSSSHQEIDRLNIFQATFLAMRRAVAAVKLKPKFLLIDGRFIIPRLAIPQKAVVKGDGKHFLIAAASIVAKVTRDKIMLDWHRQFPEYNFCSHKGYGTKEHLQQLKKNGPCAIHRQTFQPVACLLSPIK